MRIQAIEEELAVGAWGRETDDMLRIWAEECRKIGNDHVICTNDKDLRCIPGMYYDIQKNILEEITEEQAVRFFYEQLLRGDSTDNVPGIPGIGLKKAAQWLEECHTEAEMRAAVIDAYKTVFEDNWRSQLLSNGKMLHLQRHPDDYFEIEGWLQEQSLTT